MKADVEHNSAVRGLPPACREEHERMKLNASPTLVAVALAVATLSSTVLAQWATHPDPSVPRTKTGEPDLDAPAPRMPDGKPDLSGLWEVRNAAPGRGTPPPPEPADAPPIAGFRDV